jgi:MarR family transcriptional regulator, transcriptional regulator for hemolysin
MRTRSTRADTVNPERSAVVHPIQVLGFSLFETGRLYTRDFQRRSRALALDLMECRALVTLAQNEGITQRRLAELIAVDTVALGRILDRLELWGWTERRPRPGDRRARSLAITPGGRALVPPIWRIVKQSQLAALADLSRHETLILIKALHRVLVYLKADPSVVAVQASLARGTPC